MSVAPVGRLDRLGGRPAKPRGGRAACTGWRPPAAGRWSALPQMSACSCTTAAGSCAGWQHAGEFDLFPPPRRYSAGVRRRAGNESRAVCAAGQGAVKTGRAPRCWCFDRIRHLSHDAQEWAARAVLSGTGAAIGGGLGVGLGGLNLGDKWWLGDSPSVARSPPCGSLPSRRILAVVAPTAPVLAQRPYEASVPEVTSRNRSCTPFHRDGRPVRVVRR